MPDSNCRRATPAPSQLKSQRSPREIFQEAMAVPPFTREEIVEKARQVAAVRAEDERRRHAPTQLSLEAMA